MVFNKGAKAIEEQVAAGSVRSDRVDYLKVEDGKSVIIRMLTEGDALIRVAQHNYVKTKPAPKDAKKWPKGITAVCREDVQLAEMYPDGCYVCTNKLPNAQRTNEYAKPIPRVWALAVLRQPVLGDGSPERGGPERSGKVVGYSDVIEEYDIRDDSGKVTGKGKRPKIVIINQAWQNFFAGLAHFYSVYGTLCDRDYLISKSGSGMEVQYPSAPLVETPNLKPGTESWKRYEKVLADREIDLDGIVIGMSTDEWVARWLDPTKAVDKDGKIVPAGQVETGQDAGSADGFDATGAFEPVTPETEADMEALRRHLMGETTS